VTSKLSLEAAYDYDAGCSERGPSSSIRLPRAPSEFASARSGFCSSARIHGLPAAARAR
jgi:hypothetical protein